MRMAGANPYLQRSKVSTGTAGEQVKSQASRPGARPTLKVSFWPTPADVAVTFISVFLLAGGGGEGGGGEEVVGQLREGGGGFQRPGSPGQPGFNKTEAEAVGAAPNEG